MWLSKMENLLCYLKPEIFSVLFFFFSFLLVGFCVFVWFFLKDL